MREEMMYGSKRAVAMNHISCPPSGNNQIGCLNERNQMSLTETILKESMVSLEKFQLSSISKYKVLNNIASRWINHDANRQTYSSSNHMKV
jgi:hypothetical protein